MSNLIDLVAADRPAQPNRPTCSFDSVSGKFTFAWSPAASASTCAPITGYDFQIKNQNGYNY